MKALYEVRAAHTAIGGTGPGRRTATQQINYAFAVLLMAEFQGFCRDLYAETAALLLRGVQSPALATMLSTNMNAGLQLDRGNPNAGNLGSDFDRLGFRFWRQVYAHDARNDGRREKLDELARWRNAIAHQDFGHADLRQGRLTLHMVERWFSACHGLAGSFDAVTGDQVLALTGSKPW